VKRVSKVRSFEHEAERVKDLIILNLPASPPQSPSPGVRGGRDGEIHTEKEIQNHDEGRTGELERFGIKVICFTNNQILHDSNLVIEKINATIIELSKTS
jgi:hypothetical protein